MVCPLTNNRPQRQVIISKVLLPGPTKPLGNLLHPKPHFVSILGWDHALRRSHSWSAKRNVPRAPPSKVAVVDFSAASRSERVAPRESESGVWRAGAEDNLSKGNLQVPRLRIIHGRMPWKSLQRRTQRPVWVSRRCPEHSSVVVMLCRMTYRSLRDHGRHRVCSHTEVQSPPDRRLSELTAQMSCKLHRFRQEETRNLRRSENRLPTALLPKHFLLPRTLVLI